MAVKANSKAAAKNQPPSDAELTKQVMAGLKAGKKLHELSAELGRPAGKLAMLRMIAECQPADQIKGTDAQIKTGIVKARKAGFSWGAITARTRPLLAEQRVKALYTEATGTPTLGLRNGKGGRPPGSGKKNQPTAVKAAPARKAAAAKAKAPARDVIGVPSVKAAAKKTIAKPAAVRPAAKAGTAKAKAAAPAEARPFSAAERSARAKAAKAAKATTPSA